MSKNYNQLGFEQRYQIEAFLKAGMKQNFIASALGVHPSTICRELGRNVAKRGRSANVYSAEKAQKKTDLRHKEKDKHIVFNNEMKQTIESRIIHDKWSPELIYQSAKLSNEQMVSHERIYQWIWECKKSNKRNDRKYKRFYEHLKHGKRRRKRGKRKDCRGLIPNRVPIEKRPSIVKKRTRLGDLEGDLMMGKNHKGAVLVFVDRATRITSLRKLSSKEAKNLVRQGKVSIQNLGFKVQTITLDNDKVFSRHHELGKACGAKIYFTRPYTSQDKGTVENRIGVLRRFLPKKTDLSCVTNKQLKEIENKLNDRPMRKFNYLTPKQVLQKKIALIT